MALAPLSSSPVTTARPLVGRSYLALTRDNMSRGEARRSHGRAGPRMMVDDREEDIKAKIAKLRGATSKGETYEKVMGKGKTITEKMEKSKEALGEEEKAAEKALREKVLVKGRRGDMVSELEEGRRTFVRDEDDPEFEANILDGLMKSGDDVSSALINAAEIEASTTGARARRQVFDGGFSTTMGDAEAFLSQKSTFEKLEALREVSEEEGERGGAEIGEEDGDERGADKDVPADTSTQVGNSRPTGSVGGKWDGPPPEAEVDKHKPAVSTWGVFERPKDISRAYGGGRDPRQRQVDPEEQKRRDEETQALLQRYRGSVNADLELENANEDKIKAALQQSRKAMRFGDTYGAVSALEEVKEVSSPSGPLGGVVYLELGMALEATGRSFDAQDIYRLLKRSQNTDVRSKAKRLDAGLEAMDTLRYGRPGEVQTTSEFTKMWSASYSQLSVDSDVKYETSYFAKDVDGKPERIRVFSVQQAKEALLAAVEYGRRFSSFRVAQAFEFLHERSEDASKAARLGRQELEREREKSPPLLPGRGGAPDDRATLGRGAATAAAGVGAGAGAGAAGRGSVAKGSQVADEEPEPSRGTSGEGEGEGEVLAGLLALVGEPGEVGRKLEGAWRLAIKACVNVKHARQGDSQLSLGGGATGMSASLVEPSGFLSTKKVGTWSFNQDTRSILLLFERATWGGFLPKDCATETLQVLAMDDKVLVTKDSGQSENGPPSYQLWLR